MTVMTRAAKRSASRTATALRVAVAIGLALATATGCSGKTTDAASTAKPARAKTLARGDQAPRLSFVSLKGDTLTVADSARPATLVNVWATWCTSCREEFAELEHLRKEYGASGFDVSAVSVDQGSDVKVRKFVEAQGSTFRVAHDPDGRIQNEYGIVGLPTSFLLDQHGTVRWTYTGDFRLDSAGLIKALHETLGR